MTSKKKTVAFASAQNTSTADELLNQLVAFRKIGDITVETRIGPSDATVAETIVINADGTPTRLGEIYCWWNQVRRAIAAATAETPWIAGKFTLRGNTYVLEPLTDEETATVRKGLLAAAE